MAQPHPPRDVPRDRRVGFACVFVAAILWSFSGFFAKAPIFESWPEGSRGTQLAFWRAVFACAALGFFVRRIEWRWTMLTMVACFCVMNWLYLTAMVQIEGSIAIWLQSTAPVWVFLASAISRSERIVPADWRMLAWAVAGVSLILGFQVQRAPSSGLLYALLSGAMYAAVVLSLRRLRSCDAAWLIFLNHLATALVFAPFVIGRRAVPTATQFGFLLAFGALQMGLPYVIFSTGLKRIPGHEASLIGLIEPVMLPVWVFIAWRHHPQYAAPHWSTLVGGGFILIGLAQRYIAPRRSTSAESAST